MTNAILRGKSDAGNPHVRFDEGEVAPGNPRRGSRLDSAKTLLLLASFIVTSAVAADVFVDAGETILKNVSSGTETESGRVAIDADGTLVKTGAGAWVVPLSSVFQSQPFAITVAEGEFGLAAESATPPANDVPNAILKKAGLWLSTKDADASHFVKNGDSLIRWYDVRETDVSAPHYYNVLTDGTFVASAPLLAETNGVTAVYFNGVGSGTAMRFYYPRGGMSALKTYHLFAVVGFYKTQGSVFGSGGSAGNFFMANVPLESDGQTPRDIAAGGAVTYADASRLWNSTARGTTHVDGALFDAYWQMPPVGRFHLFDFGSPAVQNTATLFGQWGGKKYWGGDYLAEAIVFTNQLESAERLAVQTYLLRKWFPERLAAARQAQKTVTTRASGAYVVETNDALVETNLTLVGSGGIVKRGTGSYRYRVTGDGDDEVLFANHALTVAGGSVSLETQIPVAASAGSTLTTSIDDNGHAALEVGTAAVKTLKKSGVGDVTVTDYPSGVTNLSVVAGALELVPALTNVIPEEAAFDVAIHDPSFENWATDAEWNTLVLDKATGGMIMPNTWPAYTNGWRRSVNQTWLVNWELYRKAASYNFTHCPRDGRVFAIVYQNGVLETEVTIPKKGRYELSLDVCGREETTYLGGYLTCSLQNSGTAVATFGRAYFYEFGFRRVALQATVNATGTFQLRFQNVNVDGYPVSLDNVRLRYIPECDRDRSVAVANGTFEYNRDAFGAAARTPETTSPFANWTFANDAGDVSLVCGAVTNADADATAGVNYNPSLGAAGGFRQLLFKSGACSATVTFTPPAGTYRLTADLARYYQNRGQMTATLTVGGGEPQNLGTLVISNTLFKSASWPVAFATDGSEVSVTFSYARSQVPSSAANGMWMDNVRLTVPSSASGNLLQNAGFEQPLSGGSNWAKGWTRLSAGDNPNVQPYSYLPNIFSADLIDGDYFLYFDRCGGAAQEVAFDRPGRYRLSFHAAISQRGASTDSADAWYHGSTPIRAWLAQGSVTNEIGRTGPVLNTAYRQYVWDFDVARAGTYTFGIQGTVTTRGYNACVDALAIRRLDTTRLAPTSGPAFDPETCISVSKDARLRVDFEGTNCIRELRLGGLKQHGTIDVRDYPAYLSGRGVFKVADSAGLIFIIR